MTRVHSDRLVIPNGQGCKTEATEDNLRTWVESVFKTTVKTWTQISGGNRCRSWVIGLADNKDGPEKVYLRYQPPRAPSAEPYTVWREAQIYRAIEATNVCAPRLLAVHEMHQAIITTAADGRADFRRLTDETQKTAIVKEFVHSLVNLHACPINQLNMGLLATPANIAQCVRDEIGIWRAMYQETSSQDALIEMALNWLSANMPEPDEAPVLVHGDAGPGNFLFKGDHMTGLVDWELAHPGDPIEDLAWFCMRSVMEPVPNFAAALREYEVVSGRKIDQVRLLYHRVFVSTRVVIIRHRNVTGLPGNSIVSRSLNRRLLIDALAAAEGVRLPPHSPIEPVTTERSIFYDEIIGDLRDLSEQQQPDVMIFAKNTAKVIKFLRQYDSIGDKVEARTLGLISSLLDRDLDDLETAHQQFAKAVKANQIDTIPALQTFSALVAMDAQLAAPSSGRMATRSFPPITQEE